MITGKTVAPLGRTLLPACLVDPQSLKESSPGFGGFGGFQFLGVFPWVGVRAIMASAGRERPPVSGCLQYGWVEETSEPGWVCAVK